MDPGLSFALGVLIALVVALLVVLWRIPYVRHEALQEYRDQLAREGEVRAKEQVYAEREQAEAALETARGELETRDARCRLREDALDRRTEGLEGRDRELTAREETLKVERAALDTKTAELERLRERQMRALERISGMRREEAEHLLLERVEQTCRAESDEVVARAEAELQKTLQARARDTLLTAMQRLATSQAHEALVTTVPIDDDQKPLLVGREGRNARAFETHTGVDLLIDDTPGVVVLSAFEPVRREVARLALLRLLDEGRVHPERIEEVVSDCRQEMEEAVQHLGAQAAEKAQVGGLHPRLITLLGRLEFRTSQGRNVLQHAVETAQLAGTLAAELQLDPTVGRRCGLLHSIGKAVEHEAEGSHTAVGADFARRCNEDPTVVNAIAAQNSEAPPSSPYAVLVQVAGTLCTQRPAARDPAVEQAIRRRQEIEAIAAQHEGVERAYAVQAGRVLRVVVDPSSISDKAALRLARDIAKAIEETQGPGEVKVTVIRETRASEVAG